MYGSKLYIYKRFIVSKVSIFTLITIDIKDGGKIRFLPVKKINLSKVLTRNLTYCPLPQTESLDSHEKK